MIKLIYYCYKNWSNLSQIFVRNSIYRKFRRIYFRFSIFDGLDKFFFSMVLIHISTGLFGFFILDKFNLPVFEFFIFYSGCVTYFYVTSRKILGWKFFCYYWVMLMIGFLLAFLLTFAAHFVEGFEDPLYSTYLFYSERDLSLLFKYLLKFISDFKNILGNSLSFCTPGGDPNNSNIPPPLKPSWLSASTFKRVLTF